MLIIDERRECGTVPALTTEVFVIPVASNRFLIYAPLRRAAFIGNSAVVNLIADLKAKTFAPSEATEDAIEFLRRLQLIDAGPDHEPIETFTGTPEPTAVTLFLTTVCNLRCTYCYASAGEHPVKSMSLDTAKRGIEFVVQNALKRGSSSFEVGFHGGGEPTVLWTVLTEANCYAKQRAAETGLRVHTSSATNGVMTESQTDWVIKNLDSVTLSFDGLPAAQDKHRLTVLGQGSSNIVLRTMRRFDEAGYKYSIRMTVTADNIPLLPESVEFILKNHKPDAVQVEPSYQLGRWRGAPSAETAAFIDAYRVAQARAQVLGREISYSAARAGTLTNHFCGISRDGFSLSPDGNVSACFEVFAEDLPWADHFFYGRPTNGGGYEFDDRVLGRLRSQSVEHRDYCSGCFAKWSCAGDCYHKSLSTSGSDEFQGTERCHITRELTKDQILGRIAASGGLFWHEEEQESGCPECGGIQ
jgi:uncharacterized protein